MKKKILSIAIALSLLITFAPAASAAGETLTFTVREGLSFTVSNAVLSAETILMKTWDFDDETDTSISYIEERPVYYVFDGLSLLTIVAGEVYINGIGGYEAYGTMIDEDTGMEYFDLLSAPRVLYANDSVPDYYEDTDSEMLLTRSALVEEPYNYGSFFQMGGFMVGFVFKFVDELPDNPSTLTPQVAVNVNGNRVSFDQPPIIQEGRTLVPLRAIFEALGADVEWEDATQTVTAVRQGVAIEMQIGNSVFSVNGEQKTLDVPPQLVGGRTLVPVRAIAESFGAEVGWDQDTSTVTITE